MIWKKGRGKLGVFAPLIGSWEAEADSPRGPVKCLRTFSQILNNTHVLLMVHWQMGTTSYEEVALFESDKDGKIRFWSFTSDGKHSQGELVVATDVHEEAIGFEAQMPAGTARQLYWPVPYDAANAAPLVNTNLNKVFDTDACENTKEGFYWAVESRNKKGWNRFTEHHYHKTSI